MRERIMWVRGEECRSACRERGCSWRALVRWGVGLVVALAVLLGSRRSAQADLWINRSINATRVHHSVVSLTAGVAYRFRTTALVPRAGSSSPPSDVFGLRHDETTPGCFGS